jgi:predicted GNAT family N-acyltransferase
MHGIMIPADFLVTIADWSNPTQRAACRAIRKAVFVEEQGVPQEQEGDAQDDVSRHALAWDAHGRPIGTGRLTPKQMIGRMAVVADWRGRGVGSAILRLLLEQAQALHYPKVTMHAQLHAVAFYEKFGFHAFGEEFVECGIRHVHMQREIAPLVAPPRPALPERPPPRLVAVDSQEQALAATLELLTAARREACIYTRDLDPPLYDQEPVLEALKRLAIKGRGVGIRILVQEPRTPAQNGHRLIALAQRLASAFALRTPVEDEDRQYPSAFLLTDVPGYYFRALGSRYEGEAVTHAVGKHAQLLDFFNQVWERSEPSEELRRLSL